MNFKLKLTCSLLLILLTGCKKSGKEATPDRDFTQEDTGCIKRVLKEDDSLGSLRNEAGRKMSASKSILQYTAALKALNFQECPHAFTEAFKKHRMAWEEMLPITDKYSALRGELHEVFDSIAVSKDSVEFQKRLDKIWTTWEMVEERSTP